MHTNEERIEAIRRRAAQIEQKNRQSRVRVMQSAGIAAGFLCVIALAWIMPDITAAEVPAAIAESMRGSIFSDTGALGFLVIGVISFLLGISVTLFCFQLKKWSDRKNSEQQKKNGQDQTP